MLTNVSGKFYYVLQNKTKKLSICVVRFMRTKAVFMEDCFLPDIDCTTLLINNNIQWFLLTLNWAQLFFILFFFKKFSTTIDKIIFFCHWNFIFIGFITTCFIELQKFIIHLTWYWWEVVCIIWIYIVFKLMIRSIIIVL